MTELSFASPLSSPDPIEIHLVEGNNSENQQTYHYVALHRSAVRDLFISLKCKTTDIEHHGVILASGFGTPDAETLAYIQSLLKADGS